MKKEENKLVKEVIEDFNKRAMARKSFDNIWKINMNFLMGNQFCSVGYSGVEESEKQFFWQEREVFISITLLKIISVQPIFTGYIIHVVKVYV